MKQLKPSDIQEDDIAGHEFHASFLYSSVDKVCDDRVEVSNGEFEYGLDVKLEDIYSVFRNVWRKW